MDSEEVSIIQVSKISFFSVKLWAHVNITIILFPFLADMEARNDWYLPMEDDEMEEADQPQQEEPPDIVEDEEVEFVEDGDDDGPPQLFPEVPLDEDEEDNFEDGDDDGGAYDDMPVLEPQVAPQAPPPVLYRGNDGTVWTTQLPNQNVRRPIQNMVGNIDGQPVGIPPGASMSDIFRLYLNDEMLDMILRYL